MDKHIRRLDADLARFENDLKEKLEQSGYESADGRALKSKSGNQKTFPVSLHDKFCYYEQFLNFFPPLFFFFFPPESEMRSQREKRGSRGRGRKGSDEDSPRKKKKAR